MAEFEFGSEVKRLAHCGICCLQLKKKNDLNLIQGKNNHMEEIRDLSFGPQLLLLPRKLKYVCKTCLTLLVQRQQHKRKVQELDKKLAINFEDGLKKDTVHFSSSEEPGSSLSEQISCRPIFMTSTPAAKEPAKKIIILSAATSNKSSKCNSATKSLDFNVGEAQLRKDTKVEVTVNWRSRSKNRSLPSDLIPLGTMLCRGTYKQIASAAWKHQQIKSNIIAKFLNEIEKECRLVCMRGSEKRDTTPSILRQTKKEDILQFTFDKLKDELKQKSPLLWSVMKAASTSKPKSVTEQMPWVRAACMAISVCLKCRHPHMTALQLLISIIIQHSGIMVSCLLHFFLAFFKLKSILCKQGPL